MKNATLLTVLDAAGPADSHKAIAETARTQNIHLSYLVVGTVPQFPNYGVGMLPYGTPVVPDTWQDAVAQTNAELQTKVDALETFLSRETMSGDVISAYAEPTGLSDVAAWRARLCDLSFVSNDLRREPLAFNSVLHGLLMDSAAAVVINDDTGAKTLNASHILIAWNTGLPAARAVKQALPLLKRAASVTIACFDPIMNEMADGENPGSDIGKWLAHHGCNVTLEQHPSGGKTVATCILERAEDVGADLIVAGAYGHARLRETLFGGTTASLIEQRDKSVLMAH